MSNTDCEFELMEAGKESNSTVDLVLKCNTKFQSNFINKCRLFHVHIVCSKDKPAIIEHFLKLGASIKQPVEPRCHLCEKFNPLHFAAKFGCWETIEILLKNGADVSHKDSKGMTALHLAAQESCLEVVNLLLQYSGDIVSVNSQGKTPLHLAFENKNYGIMDLLLSACNIADSNPIDRKGISHFHIACTRNNVNVIKKFIERGVSIDTCVLAYSDNETLYHKTVDWSGYSPLHFAVHHNKARIVQLLLDCGANVWIKNSKGRTVHHISCSFAYETFAEFIENILCDLKKYRTGHQFHLLTNVAEKCVNNSGLKGVIDWSANRSEHLEIINSLFHNDIDANCTDDNGNTSLFYACWFINFAVRDMQKGIEKRFGCLEATSVKIAESLSKELNERQKLIVSHFLKLNANLDKCSQHGSILHCICSDKESSKMMELFIKRGANVNARNNEMWTPLHKAAMYENTNAVRILLNYNADTDFADSRDNSTPLLIASQRPSQSSFDIIKLLADHGANVNAKRTNGKTALHDFASLCTDKDVACITDEHVFPFDAVVSAMFTLIENGAHVDSRDSNGYTPLHVACHAANNRSVSVLLKHGADVNAEDKDGRSVCCYLYRTFRTSEMFFILPEYAEKMVTVLRKHIVKMKEIGMPISEKTVSSIARCDRMIILCEKRLTEEQEKELIEGCRKEVQVLKSTKIHDNCTLYDVIFKNENALSRLVKNPAFEAVVKSETFWTKFFNYGYLIVLKYREGLKRSDLLPKTKCVLNKMSGLRLPDVCSENICKYFRNFELKESTKMLYRTLTVFEDGKFK